MSGDRAKTRTGITPVISSSRGYAGQENKSAKNDLSHVDRRPCDGAESNEASKGGHPTLASNRNPSVTRETTLTEPNPQDAGWQSVSEVAARLVARAAAKAGVE